MKQVKLTLTFVLLCVICKATVRTVNNNGGGQFSTIEAAVVASSAVTSDTIYVCGSAISYAAPTTRKDNLTFIGAGFNPQKQLPVKTTIAATPAFNVANNNKLIGMEILPQINYVSGVTAITILRCVIATAMVGNSPYVMGNVSIDKCIISTGQLLANGTISNLLVTNSIFYSPSSNIPFISLLSVGSGIVDHCTFIQATGSTTIILNPPLTGFSFSNNLYFNSTPGYTTNYSYYNNQSSASNLNSSGSGNITSAIYPFVQAQGTVTGAYQFAWNFQVLPGSTAHNAATDGTDIGAYGGPTPFKFDGEPAIPQIDIMNLQGTQFAPGSTIQLNFQSSVQD